MFRPRGSDLNIKIEDYSQVVHMKQMVTIELPRNSALHLNDIVLPLDDTPFPTKPENYVDGQKHTDFKYRQNRETQHFNLVPRT